jgi:hypothetical protein
VPNCLLEILTSAARQVVCVVMILFGSLLAASVSVGPCGGTVLAVEPFPAILVAIFGFGLVVLSYLFVKKLKVEADFRVVIYLFLGLWSMSLLLPAVSLVRFGMPLAREDINDFYFSLLRGFRCTCQSVLVLTLGGREKYDYPFMVILATAVLLLEWRSRIISWQRDTGLLGLFRA